MKISIINGSPRSNGATAKILTETSDYLSDKYNAEIFFVDLGQITPLQYCRGCEVCYRTGNCVIKDDKLEEIVKQIKLSDGVVIGSPTYGSNISGLLKNFMDRGHFIVEQSLFGKSSFSVATYEIADGQETLKIINKFFLVSGAGRRGDFLVKVPFNAEPLINQNIKKILYHRLDNFALSISSHKGKSLFERIFNDLIVVRLIWKPIFFRQSNKYKAVLDLWRRNGVI